MLTSSKHNQAPKFRLSLTVCSLALSVGLSIAITTYSPAHAANPVQNFLSSWAPSSKGQDIKEQADSFFRLSGLPANAQVYYKVLSGRKIIYETAEKTDAYGHLKVSYQPYNAAEETTKLSENELYHVHSFKIQNEQGNFVDILLRQNLENGVITASGQGFDAFSNMYLMTARHSQLSKTDWSGSFYEHAQDIHSAGRLKLAFGNMGHMHSSTDTPSKWIIEVGLLDTASQIAGNAGVDLPTSLLDVPNGSVVKDAINAIQDLPTNAAKDVINTLTSDQQSILFEKLKSTGADLSSFSDFTSQLGDLKNLTQDVVGSVVDIDLTLITPDAALEKLQSLSLDVINESEAIKLIEAAKNFTPDQINSALTTVAQDFGLDQIQGLADTLTNFTQNEFISKISALTDLELESLLGDLPIDNLQSILESAGVSDISSLLNLDASVIQDAIAGNLTDLTSSLYNGALSDVLSSFPELEALYDSLPIDQAQALLDQFGVSSFADLASLDLDTVKSAVLDKAVALGDDFIATALGELPIEDLQNILSDLPIGDLQAALDSLGVDAITDLVNLDASAIAEAIAGQFENIAGDALDLVAGMLGLDNVNIGGLLGSVSSLNGSLTGGGGMVSDAAATDAKIRANHIPALMLMTEELSAITMQSTAAVGQFFDAKQQLEVQALHQKLKARAIKDYHPSEEMCRVGSYMRSIATTEQKMETDKAILNKTLMARYNNKLGTSTAPSDLDYLETRLHEFKTIYCDPADNNGGLGICERPTGTSIDANRLNKDIDYYATLAYPKTLDIDLVDGSETTDEQDILALAGNLYWPQPLGISANTDDISANESGYLNSRRLKAMTNIAHASFVEIVAQKSRAPLVTGTQEPGWSFMKTFMRELGYTDDAEIEAVIGENPSYWAQMEILSKKIYQSPHFYTNLYDKPANVDRMSVALDAIGLMQMRDYYNSRLRMEMLNSAALEMELVNKGHYGRAQGKLLAPE